MRRVKTYLETKAVGLTGGIGSGQSTVGEIFSRFGCKIINLDLKAKQLIDRDRTIQNEIRKEFGASVFMGNSVLNRRILGEIVFNSEQKLQSLNRIVHPRLVPLVVEEMEAARFSRKYPIVILDAALIFELNFEQMFDLVIVVYSDQNTRIERIRKRDQLSRGEVITRLKSQIPLEEKKHWADIVIENNGTREELQKETERVFKKISDDIPVQRRIRIE